MEEDSTEPAPALAARPVAEQPEPEQPRDVEQPTFENDTRWHDVAVAIATAYRTWGRVDDENRWAPGLCRMPQPSQARISASTDAPTHGRKLYTVYAMDAEAYGYPPTATFGFLKVEGLEQALVKEAFVPRKLAEGESYDVFHGPRPAIGDDGLYVPGEPAGLYMMFRVPNAPEFTDEGWVYATVEPDGQTVSAAGRVTTCMGCHTTQEDRLFGLPGKPTGKTAANAAPRPQAARMQP